MKIIDFETWGNVVVFYLSKDDLKEWYGDDWDDSPYEHNAGKVYDQFIKDEIQVAFRAEILVADPTYGTLNSGYNKFDMVSRRIPCIILVKEYPKNVEDKWNAFHTLRELITYDKSIKIYFGDSLQTLKRKIKGIGVVLK